MSEKTRLENYLFSPQNSHAKESLINNKLIFDLKLAAARHEYFLNVYTPEVDKDGFDIIFDDQNKLAKVQLKTVMAKANTKSWEIHKALLRPDARICEDLGFESSPTGTGYQGGVILIEVADTELKKFEVTYYYTDIIFICGLRDEIIRSIDPPSEKALKTFVEKIEKGISHEKITLYKNMFLQAKSPESLLALMGMHSTENVQGFRFHIQQLVDSQIKKDLPCPRDKLIDFVNGELRQISCSIAP